MEKIDFKKQNIPFTQVANGVLNDSRISYMAKGVYAYLYSKPEGWDFSENRIAKDAKNSRRSVRTALKELEDIGYLVRFKLPSGRMVYRVIFPPLEDSCLGSSDPEYQNVTLAQKPEYQNATVTKRHSDETLPISNTVSKVIKSISNTNSKSADLQLSTEIPLVIESFVNVNKACKDFYGNTTQRKYVQKLIETYGIDKTLKVVAFLPQANRKLYNKATTPKELWDKWSKIEAEAQQLKQKNNKYQLTEIF